METKDDKMRNLYIRIANLNNEHKGAEALKVVNGIVLELHRGNKDILEGVSWNTILLLFYSFALTYLNCEKHKYALQMVGIAKKCARTHKVSNSYLIEIGIIEARVYERQGELEHAIKILEELEGLPMPDRENYEIQMQKGVIQSHQAKLNVTVNSLSYALALAEKMGDEERIADVYRELSYMLSPKYPALGLSLTRTAHILYTHRNNKFDSLLTQLLMAQSCISIHTTGRQFYGAETKYFFNEGLHLLSSILRDDLPRYSDKALYDRVCGIAFGDTNKLWHAFYEYKEIGGTAEAMGIAETIGIIASMQGKFQEAIKAEEIYLEMSQELGDIERVESAKYIIGCLKQGMVGDISLERRKDEPQTLLHILDKISFDEECEFFRTPPHRKRYVNPEDEGKCIPLENADGTLSLYPFCRKSFNYYRGQTRRFVPCKPSLYRNGMTPSKQYLERVRYAEFHLLIDTHPICEKYVNSSKLLLSSQNKDYKFRIYHQALAQHYGVATELIDLTADKWVAAFFAATDYEGGEYKVHTDTSEQGIFYICEEPNFKQLDTLPNPIEPKIKPIGIQPFPRPGEQRGYAYPMEPEEDFETKVKEMIPFHHDPRINELIFNFANRSKRLFPDDVLKDKANTIEKSLTFSEAAYRMARQMFYPKESQEQFDKWECEENMKHQNDPITAFTEEDIKDFCNSYLKFERELKEKIIRL